MADAELALGRIGQIAVNAKDLERATAFYRDALGMRFLFQVPGMSFFDCDGIRLMLGVAESAEYDHRASILYFKVDGIEGAHAALAARGVEVIREPGLVADLGTHELWLCFFRDSEDNVHALMEEKAKR